LGTICRFHFSVGLVSSTTPLGPDEYGYVIYDWTDTAYPEAPVYAWIPIAPANGGLGTTNWLSLMPIPAAMKVIKTGADLLGTRSV
jgi:hypothetical protein